MTIPTISRPFLASQAPAYESDPLDELAWATPPLIEQTESLVLSDDPPPALSCPRLGTGEKLAAGGLLLALAAAWVALAPGPAWWPAESQISVSLETTIPDYGRDVPAVLVNHQIEQAALRYGIPEARLKALAWNMSEWDPNRITEGGFGLLQLHPARHSGFFDAHEWQNPAHQLEYVGPLLQQAYGETGDWDLAMARFAGTGDGYGTLLQAYVEVAPWSTYDVTN